MNKIIMNKQSCLINKTDINSIGIPLEGGGVFIEDPHLTKIFSTITARIVELETKVQELSKEK
ncbi:TPA: hypothetical protein U2I45_002003 [Providencia rettgeri]|nr:hypothetical protein [Providencia rettgeri]HEM6859134.1 hypothetical protein [Providencia rettgeri]